jgi:hypothetical protein
VLYGEASFKEINISGEEYNDGELLNLYLKP